jgi:hypothetical protein
MLIAVSSFGESLRRVLLTAPAEAVLMDPPSMLELYKIFQNVLDSEPPARIQSIYLNTGIFYRYPSIFGDFKPPRVESYGI